MTLAPSVLLPALLAACGGDAGRPATWVPPRAERSVARLPAAQRAAGMALVRLERAARAGDAEELCGSVYRFQTRVPIPRAECARGLKDAFAPDGCDGRYGSAAAFPQHDVPARARQRDLVRRVRHIRARSLSAKPRSGPSPPGSASALRGICRVANGG